MEEENRAVERKSAWTGWNELNRESDDEMRVARPRDGTYANASVLFVFIFCFTLLRFLSQRSSDNFRSNGRRITFVTTTI